MSTFQLIYFRFLSKIFNINFRRLETFSWSFYKKGVYSYIVNYWCYFFYWFIERDAFSGRFLVLFIIWAIRGKPSSECPFRVTSCVRREFQTILTTNFLWHCTQPENIAIPGSILGTSCIKFCIWLTWMGFYRVIAEFSTNQLILDIFLLMF